ncbi:PepSY domain-containing protein [Alteromonas sp. H39]|uniref:PepSY domain-containing protein n=1 Tax=Alteromonas sp. H39 TaxID=3389876 RepID=UPI0039DF976F
MIAFSRRWHRRIMLFTGLQFLLWTASGLYMVITDIHFIHGETLVTQQKPDIDWQQVKISVNALLSEYPEASDVSLSMHAGLPVYRFRHTEDNTRAMVNATSGEAIPLLSQSQAEAVAQASMKVKVPVEDALLFTSNGPEEVSPRHLPYWQVTFEGWTSPTLYVSAATGEVVTIRHHFWRAFDWMWRLHIMDWDDGADVGNIFLLIFAFSGLFAAFVGAHLTLFHVKRPVKKWIKG